jgi:hypothetical protein
MNENAPTGSVGFGHGGVQDVADSGPVILITTSTTCATPGELTVEAKELMLGQRATLALATALGLPVIVSPVSGGLERIDAALLNGAALQQRLRPRACPDAFQCGSLFSDIDTRPHKSLVLTGVATEVEILLTAMTALRRGFEVYVLVDACAGCNARTESAALQTMAAQGVRLFNTAALLGQLLRDVTTPHARASAERVMFERIGVTKRSPSQATPVAQTTH